MLGNIVAGTFSAGAPPIPPSSYESIATVTVGSGGSSSIDFTSIPSGYKHLQVRALFKTGDQIWGRFNGDTGSNYSAHSLFTDGGGSVSALSSQQTYMYFAYTGYSSPNAWGSMVYDILDYGSTSKFKTARTLLGYDNNGSGAIFFTSGNWRSTSAITTVTIYPNTGTFAEYSQFALYGIKD
jgi:hypothetical protein